MVLYEFDDTERVLTSCAMICVKQPKAKVSDWDKQEPPVYSASLAVINAGSDHNSLVKAKAFYYSESMKTNKLAHILCYKPRH